MDATSATLDSGIFERNLEALDRADPTLANRLQSTPTADIEAIPAVARDGQMNFRWVRPDGSWEWFGRTSIPTVRAEAILARSDLGRANILLPSIGEGTEAALLVQRLGRHRALFVWEEDPFSVRLVLKLHDLAEAIADERLIPLVCSLDDLTQTLASWLNAHPGHLCPSRLLMWPWQTVMSLNPCRVALETAAQSAESQRQNTLQGLSAKTDKRTGPQVALLATGSDDTTLETVEALSTGAAALGWQTTDLAIRRPHDVHPLARATRLAEAGLPETAILIDTTRREIRDVLPEEVAVVSWLSGRVPIPTDLASRVGPKDAVAVTGVRRRDQMIAAGIDAGRVHVCPPACLASAADGEPIPDAQQRPIDLLILADLPPLDADRLGYTLDTHAKIWKTALDLLRARIERFSDDQAADLLARAEKKAGAAIEDAALRNTMIEHLANPGANALAWPFFTQAVSRKDLTVEIRGSGWPKPRPPLAGPAERQALLGRAKTVLHLDATGEVSPTVMAAAGHGAVVLAHRHTRDQEPGGLATLLTPGDEFLPFDTARDLVATLADLLGNAERLGQIAQKARSRCLSDHMPAQRLAALRAIASS